MANIIANQALGRIREFADDAAGDVAAAQLRMYLLKAAEADDALRDHDTMSALLGAAGNTEADFTNYANKVIENGDITVTVDDTNNRMTVDVPDQTWSSAGGTTDNTLTDAVVAYDPDGTDTDSQNIPMSIHDFTPTTSGADLTLQVDASGLVRAS